MPTTNQLFTVICRWNPDVNACDHWQTIAVVLRSNFGAKDAANEACLFLIWDRQGQAQPLLVFEGDPKLIALNGGIFDAQEYDETITFSRRIVSCHGLG
jgi:hypothetical protein